MGHQRGNSLMCCVIQLQIHSRPWAVHTKILRIDHHIDALIDRMFVEDESSDMANYWHSFMMMVEALMINVWAVHKCNWEQYFESLREMMPWMVIYDQTNYGRWLPSLRAILTSPPIKQTQFLSANFAQSMTGKPYSCIAWDMWIEMTMYEGSKLKAGWLSILQNENQLMADTRNANNLDQVRAALDNQVNRKQLSQKHNECTPARLHVDEQAVQDIISSIKEFDCFTFNPASPTLRAMRSAIPAPVELIHDLRTTKEDCET